jgi:hypothetical protein
MGLDAALSWCFSTALRTDRRNCAFHLTPLSGFRVGIRFGLVIWILSASPRWMAFRFALAVRKASGSDERKLW